MSAKVAETPEEGKKRQKTLRENQGTPGDAGGTHVTGHNSTGIDSDSTFS